MGKLVSADIFKWAKIFIGKDVFLKYSLIFAKN